MIIYPAHTLNATAHEYVSGGVSTTVDAASYMVGVAYRGQSVVEIIRQAYLNAMVKRMRLGLARKLSVTHCCDTEQGVVQGQ